MELDWAIQLLVVSGTVFKQEDGSQQHGIAPGGFLKVGLPASSAVTHPFMLLGTEHDNRVMQ